MTVTIEYQLDNTDLARAAQAIAFNGEDALTRVRRAREWGFVLAVLLVLMIFLSAWYFGPHSIDRIYWIFVLLTGIVAPVPLIRKRKRLRRIFQSLARRTDLRLTRTLSITPDGLVLLHSSGETVVPWFAFTRFIDGSGVLVIMREDGEAMEIIHKRAFDSPADLDALQSLLLRHRAPLTPAFPILPSQSDRMR